MSFRWVFLPGLKGLVRVWQFWLLIALIAVGTGATMRLNNIQRPEYAEQELYEWEVGISREVETLPSEKRPVVRSKVNNLALILGRVDKSQWLVHTEIQKSREEVERLIAQNRSK